MELPSLGAAALYLASRQIAVRRGLEEGLEHALQRIEETAKAEFGVYQAAVGPFPAWEALAETTQEERVKLGYTPDDPLLRKGDLRDSVSHEVDRSALEGAVGSTSDVMPYQEFGTGRIPPRPVLGPAAYRNVDTIKKLVGAAAVAGLIGGVRVHEGLGYDLTASGSGDAGA